MENFPSEVTVLIFKDINIKTSGLHLNDSAWNGKETIFYAT